ncbi:DUF1254 domain-containing protein [Microbacterium sp. KUDC0406]|uniref:DUF1214 domain-containing protein n=1 Tax=Microbacterium sp. KUDC0406 TaxID=2909588 RepID=UPI001F1FF8CA|nr:DUF1254 domain-containing protein [Microbacterium sp. KUDC0406]UJP09088.1 DUF1254 domain-containing protein [Microbacterium sp. KUDC0406]
MPAVNFQLMRETLAAGKTNQFVYWSKLLDWRNQTLTPNPDLIYYMAFFDTHDGPVVVEIPAEEDGQALNGSICNLWQVPLEDVGHFGVDEGRGGRYLILPPDWDEDVPDGYIALPGETYGSYALLRSVLEEGTQEALDRGLELCRKIRVYPLAEAANPPATSARDLQGQVVDTTIPYDLSFYELLHRAIQDEPLLARDRPFEQMLESIGIRKGEPFAPTADDAAVLTDAVGEAHAWLKAEYEGSFEPFFNGTQWFFPGRQDFTDSQRDGFDAHPEGYPYPNRGVIYHMAFIGIRRLGIGQFYLVNLRDSDGAFFSSAASYRMRLPAHVPVSQFWSVTMYDARTHAFIRDNTKYSVSSQTPGLITNDDGTVDVYFGPRAEPGQEANTIETGDSDAFELMFRFYGVGKDVMTKQWALSDVERIY